MDILAAAGDLCHVLVIVLWQGEIADVFCMESIFVPVIFLEVQSCSLSEMLIVNGDWNMAITLPVAMPKSGIPPPPLPPRPCLLPGSGVVGWLVTRLIVLYLWFPSQPVAEVDPLEAECPAPFPPGIGPRGWHRINILAWGINTYWWLCVRSSSVPHYARLHSQLLSDFIWMASSRDPHSMMWLGPTCEYGGRWVHHGTHLPINVYLFLLGDFCPAGTVLSPAVSFLD